MSGVWVTFDTPKTCQCWRDAVCSHGWTWREGDDPCEHLESYEEVHHSLADAIRSLFSIRGQGAIGSLVRQRRTDNHQTYMVYVMPPGVDLSDDHDVGFGGGPAAEYVVRRYGLVERSTPRSDPDGVRSLANEYRKVREVLG